MVHGLDSGDVENVYWAASQWPLGLVLHFTTLADSVCGLFCCRAEKQSTNWAEMLMMGVEVSIKVIEWGQMCGVYVIHLPLLAFRLLLSGWTDMGQTVLFNQDVHHIVWITKKMITGLSVQKKKWSETDIYKIACACLMTQVKVIDYIE